MIAKAELNHKRALFWSDRLGSQLIVNGERFVITCISLNRIEVFKRKDWRGRVVEIGFSENYEFTLEITPFEKISWAVEPSPKDVSITLIGFDDHLSLTYIMQAIDIGENLHCQTIPLIDNQ